ncbi:hypothetical protein [Streptococcus cuniculi]|uniref:Uncharacterized protein n=1 Tax=Streptococcus cuniculi TaxID=1432788 RepID=A0A4Y9JDA6_9STRE|nr:hypothetical protein [Streptococcus cuniculi]MBF0777414.1 hypothetical protein [Streptococcus cuniculi]TFU99010.1 hypothetical protein E4T82_01510 [Streptococcus cuniculi]
MSSIRLTRDTGMYAIASAVHVYINGEKVGKLASKESQTFEIQESEVSVQVSFWGGKKSNPVIVKAGQEWLVKRRIGNILLSTGLGYFFFPTLQLVEKD